MEENKNRSEKRKINLNNDMIFKGLVILLVITTIALIIVFLIGRNPKNDDQLINELYNYFSTDDLTNCEGLFNYSSTKVDYNTINNKTKLCIAYQKASIKNIYVDSIKTKNYEDKVVYELTVKVKNKEELDGFIKDLYNFSFVRNVVIR